MKTHRCDATPSSQAPELSYEQVVAGMEGIYSINGHSDKYVVVLVCSTLRTALLVCPDNVYPMQDSWSSYKFRKVDKKLCLEIK